MSLMGEEASSWVPNTSNFFFFVRGLERGALDLKRSERVRRSLFLPSAKKASWFLVGGASTDVWDSGGRFGSNVSVHQQTWLRWLLPAAPEPRDYFTASSLNCQPLVFPLLFAIIGNFVYHRLLLVTLHTHREHVLLRVLPQASRT